MVTQPVDHEIVDVEYEVDEHDQSGVWKLSGQALHRTESGSGGGRWNAAYISREDVQYALQCVVCILS